MKINICILMAAMFSAAPVLAWNNLHDGGTIVRVMTSYDDLPDLFAVQVQGGSGMNCTGNDKWAFRFPRSAAASDEDYAQTYSAALAAFASGSKVTIGSTNSTECSQANAINLYK